MPPPAPPAALHQVLVGPVARTGLVAILALVRVLLPIVVDGAADAGLLGDADVVDRGEQEDRLPDLRGVLRKVAAQGIDQLARAEQRHPARGVSGTGRLDEEVGVIQDQLQRLGVADLAQDNEQAVTGVLLEVSGLQARPRRLDHGVLELREPVLGRLVEVRVLLFQKVDDLVHRTDRAQLSERLERHRLREERPAAGEDRETAVLHRPSRRRAPGAAWMARARSLIVRDRVEALSSKAPAVSAAEIALTVCSPRDPRSSQL